jgi:RNA polymerase sigma-70 factor (ECF subfamily)
MTALTRTGRWPPGLVDAARCGDEKALLSLISAAQPDVRRYAARNCRAADVDDAVQETLLLLYRRIGTLRAVTSFSAWLFAVARRACHRLLRMSIGLPDDLPDAVEARLAHSRPEDIRIDLSRAIQSLPEHYREVILLRDIEEIGLTRESAKARLHRARIMIREYLIRD